MNTHMYRSGFTIVEIMTVVAIIGILSTVSVVGYGAWRNSAIETQLKNDLTGVATAMTGARNFANVYPTSVPVTFKPSRGTVLTGGGTLEGKAYCITATSGDTQYRISASGLPELGMCPAAPLGTAPVISLPVAESWSPAYAFYSSGLYFNVNVNSLATGTPVSTIQWQSKKYLPVAGTTWTDVVGATSANLRAVVGGSDVNTGDTVQYRVIYTNAAGTATSPAVNVPFVDDSVTL